MFRSPNHIALDDVCPNCGKRIWLKGEGGRSKRRYFGPKWFRQMFKDKVGRYTLGTYYIDRCAVCGKNVAVYSDNKGMFYEDVIVMYACSMLSVPLEDIDGVSCENSICYGCELKKGEFYVHKG